MTPAVAVVISSYQAEPYIECAIRSVLAQEFADFELLVQDDASTDRTAEIARSIDDRRLRVVVSGANRGAVANFNSGIAATRAEFVVKLDADDFLLPGFLSACYAALRSGDDLAFVFTEAQRIVGGRVTGLRTRWKRCAALPGRAADACAFLDEHRTCCVRKAWRHFWRLQIKRAVGPAATERFRQIRAWRSAQ